MRPITAVRFLLKGKIIQAWGGPYKGPSYIKGEDWIPYRPADEVSPPFAEYASGHSTFSAAAAEVLTAFTGRGNFELKVTIPAGSSKVEPGAVPAKPITLSWTNFRYAAEQAGLSRQYGGVHFERPWWITGRVVPAGSGRAPAGQSWSGDMAAVKNRYQASAVRVEAAASKSLRGERRRGRRGRANRAHVRGPDVELVEAMRAKVAQLNTENG